MCVIMIMTAYWKYLKENILIPKPLMAYKNRRWRVKVFWFSKIILVLVFDGNRNPTSYLLCWSSCSRAYGGVMVDICCIV